MHNSISKQLYNKPIQDISLKNNIIVQKLSKFKVSTFILLTIAFLNIIIVITIIGSLFIKTSFADLANVVQSQSTWEAIFITLGSVFISVVITIILGTPLAFVISRNNSYFYRLIDLISAIPLIIPPSIAGLCLLITFGRTGLVGQYLNDLNINIAFTFWALIFAQVFITMPIYVQLMKNSFKSIKKDIEEAAIICGAGEKELLFSIYLPITIKGFITAVILCVLRAAGEFGASIMFAGNLSGKTQTLTIAIYTLTQENLYFATALAIIMILVFILPLGIFNLYTK